jgi:hypothetical protein
MTWTLLVLITWAIQPGEAFPREQLIQVDRVSTREHCQELGQGITSFYDTESTVSSCIGVLPKKLNLNEDGV